MRKHFRRHFMILVAMGGHHLNRFSVTLLFAYGAGFELLGSYSLLMGVTAPLYFLTYCNLGRLYVTRSEGDSSDKYFAALFIAFLIFLILSTVGWLIWSPSMPFKLGLAVLVTRFGDLCFQFLIGLRERNQQIPKYARDSWTGFGIEVLSLVPIIWLGNAWAIPLLLCGAVLRFLLYTALLLLDDEFTESKLHFSSFQDGVQVLRDGLGFGAGMAINSGKTAILRVLIDLFLGRTAVGVFTLLSQFAMLLAVVNQANIRSFVQRYRDRVQSNFSSLSLRSWIPVLSLHMAYSIGSAAAIMLLLWAWQFIGDYDLGQSVYTVALLLLGSRVISGVNGHLKFLLVSQRRSNLFLISTLIALLVLTVVAVLAIPYMHLSGAALCLLLSEVVTVLILISALNFYGAK